MLYAMFGASLLTSLVSIIHAVFLLGPSALFEGITAEAEVNLCSLEAIVLPSFTLSAGRYRFDGCEFGGFVSLRISIDEEWP